MRPGKFRRISRYVSSVGLLCFAFHELPFRQASAKNIRSFIQSLSYKGKRPARAEKGRFFIHGSNQSCDGNFHELASLVFHLIVSTLACTPSVPSTTTYSQPLGFLRPHLKTQEQVSSCKVRKAYPTNLQVISTATGKAEIQCWFAYIILYTSCFHEKFFLVGIVTQSCFDSK